MANRAELGIIRAARAGQVAAQLALGKLYLFGSAGLPLSLPTALHWLDRAAQQGSAEACELIGAHIPFEVARRSERPLGRWYARAAEAGLARAGLVFAQLLLGDGPDAAAGAAGRAMALDALARAAHAGVAEAEALLASQPGAPARAIAQPAPPEGADGVRPQEFAVLDAAWESGRRDLYLQRALPLARALLHGTARDIGNAGKDGARLAPAEARLLSRCARALEGAPLHRVTADELHAMRELAAAGHDRHAQMALGLWCARMRADGERTAAGASAANFKKAIRWLTLAGEQGLAQAWYALSRIYIKPEFSQRNVVDAHRYLERAAEMGYRDAQFECGSSAWRARRENETNDVRAVYWLQKAATAGCPRAAAALRKIAPRGRAGACGADAAALAARAGQAGHSLLAARIELAALFHLSRAEALLLDVRLADHGHCLVVDIRASYGRSKRRLVLVESVVQRHALDRIVRLFDKVDAGPGGPEGNYRQRLYRLRTLSAAPAPGAPAAAGEPYELAA